MKKYVTPDIDMLKIFDAADVITTSKTLTTITKLEEDNDGTSIQVSEW